MKYLTLSFDNGPFPGGTDFVLEELARRSILASFFLVGKQLASPGAGALAQRAKAEGHWIGNHTLSHDVPLGQGRCAGRAPSAGNRPDGRSPGRAEAAGAAVQAVCGQGHSGAPRFSPPSLAHLRDHGHTVVLWNSVPRDWEQPADAWVQRALDDIDRQDWTAVVLHDRQNAAMTHLPRFLDEVQARGVVLRQDFPPDCLPLVAGEQRWDLSGLSGLSGQD
ncbi:polysaccharide deacetylase family protein [Polaromonas sp. P1(28)-13]|nr:polysaccharide deacetylase family protein [Polaromonas sp. P1(28)-13]